MKISRQLLSLTLIVGWFCLLGCQSHRQVTVFSALPDPKELGPGWTCEISVLFDPESHPSEIIGSSTKLPESFAERQRAAVLNPDTRSSGWCHAHYVSERGRRLDIQIERFHDQNDLIDDFRRLLAVPADHYTQIQVDALGDTAVFFSNSRLEGTLWFRRGSYLVWISPIASVKSWQEEAELQLLARAIDDRLRSGK